MEKRLEIGQIVAAHSLRGEVKLNPWADDAAIMEGLASVYVAGKQMQVESLRYHKNCAIVKLQGIDDRTAAERLRGSVVTVDREQLEALPEGVYYIVDLIGLSVRTEDRELGTLTDVLTTGANDVYVVTPPAGKDILLPVIPDVVRSVDLAAGVVHVTLLEGLVDDETV